MLSITLIVVLTFVSATRSNELAERSNIDLHSKDKLADKVGDKLVNKMVARELAKSLHNEDLDDTTLAKPGQNYHAQQRLNLQQNNQQFPSTFHSLRQRHDLSPLLPFKNPQYGAPSHSPLIVHAAPPFARQVRSRFKLQARKVRSNFRTEPKKEFQAWILEKLKKAVVQEVGITKELADQVTKDPKAIAAAWTVASIAFAASTDLAEAGAAASAGRWIEVLIRAVATATQLTANQVDLAAAGAAGTAALDAPEGAAGWSVLADSWQVVESIMEAGLKTWEVVEQHREQGLSAQPI